MSEEKPPSGLPQDKPHQPDFAEMLTEGVRELLGASPETARAWRTSAQDVANDRFRRWLGESVANGGHGNEAGSARPAVEVAAKAAARSGLEPKRKAFTRSQVRSPPAPPNPDSNLAGRP